MVGYVVVGEGSYFFLHLYRAKNWGFEPLFLKIFLEVLKTKHSSTAIIELYCINCKSVVHFVESCDIIKKDNKELSIWSMSLMTQSSAPSPVLHRRIGESGSSKLF